ncbi:MAG: DUF3054 domain-containing protein [Herpetosiphon sp.]
MSSQNVLTRQRLPLLVAGDILAILLFVVIGLASHREQSSYLYNLTRVAAPFLIGWFAVAPWTKAYELPVPNRATWLQRSAVTWLLGIVLGLLLRALVFRNGFVVVFAVISLVTTGILLLGWRTVFALMTQRYGNAGRQGT